MGGRHTIDTAGGCLGRYSTASTRESVWLLIRIYVCMHVCMYVCMYVCTYILPLSLGQHRDLRTTLMPMPIGHALKT